jgi:DNA-binding NarL/FixJ family response regulator
MINVLIADDQQLIRESLKIMLECPEIRVTATAADGEEALYLFEIHTPDIVLLDVRMPGMDGISCLKRIKEKSPETQVIMITTYDDEEYIFDSLRYGANGYLLKDISPHELRDAVKLVSSGGSLINPDVMKTVLRIFSDMANIHPLRQGTEAFPNTILRNEEKIIRLIGRGLANKEIAVNLSFSEGTVRNYISSILKKLDLRDRTQIAIYAVQHGLHESGRGIDE